MLWSFIKMMVKCDMSGNLSAGVRFTNKGLMGFSQDSSYIYLDVETVIY